MATGILLAAGFSRRFGAADKLMHALADGTPLALAAARNLLQAAPASIAVVRPDNKALRQLLTAAGLEVVVCGEHEVQMGDSLAAAVRHAGHCSDGYLVALADMPFIQPPTIAAVAQALVDGAAIARPAYRGQPGHPVGFAARFGDALASVGGDEGARSIVSRHRQAVKLLECDDPGVLRDIDTPADLDVIEFPAI